jgi:hypothetical protein
VEFVRTGELYLLSHRLVDDMVARLHGPGRMRFILQPTVAIILGVRDGVKDARAGSPPFLSALVFLRTGRRELVRGALASVLAILLDVVSQFLIFRMVHPGAALLLGPVLIDRMSCRSHVPATTVAIARLGDTIVYAVAAVVAAIALPRIENRVLPGFTSEMSAPAAMAIMRRSGRACSR